LHRTCLLLTQSGAAPLRLLSDLLCCNYKWQRAGHMCRRDFILLALIGSALARPHLARRTKALGITVVPTLLAQANEAIEQV